MRNPRRVIQPRSFALALGVALSLALLQGQTCDRGNTDLTSLELEVDGGPNLIVGFDTLNRSYDVSTSGSTVTVRAQAVFGVNDISWQWLVGTTTIGSGPIGTGSGEVTIPIPIPDGESLLRVVVKSNQVGSTASGFYRINITKPTDAVTETIPMTCASFAVFGYNNIAEAFELTVDPLEPVVAGTPFDAAVGGVANISEFTYNVLGALPALVTRFALGDGTVSVVPRSGATGADVALSLAAEPTTCAVDAGGNRGLGAGPFPSCDPANNIGPPNVNGFFENGDCVGLGGLPSVNNPCLPFRELTIIDGTGDACSACDAVDALDPRTNLHSVQCAAFGMCSVLDDLSYPLQTQTASFLADPGASAVLFGFEEGAVEFPTDPVPPNGFRVWYEADDGGALGAGFGWECFMGDYTNGFIQPVPDSELVSIDVRGWRGPEIISDDPGPGDAFGLDLAVNDDGSAVAVWVLDGGTSAPDSIYANVLTAGVWGTPELLATAATNPQVAVAPNGDALAVWGQVDTSSTIYGVRLIAGVWGTPDLISAGSGNAGNPRVGMDDNGNALVVWVQPDGPAVPSLYANQLTSGTWGTPVLVETDNTVFSGEQEISVAPNGDAVVVWLATDGFSIFNIYANRLVSGTWVGPGLLDTVTDPDPFDGDPISLDAPTVSVNGNGDAVAAWGSADLFFTAGIGNNIYTSQLTSGTWSAPVSVPLGAGESQPARPQVAIYPDGDAVVGYKGNDAWANQLTSGTWGPAVRLDTTSVNQPLRLTVAASPNGDAVAVWEENGFNDIYANRLTGGVWTGPVLLEGSTENAFEPSVGLDSNGNAVAAFSQSDGTIFNIYANVFE